jgi:hypothetical protein
MYKKTISSSNFKTCENYSFTSNVNLSINDILNDYNLISKKLNLIIQKLSKNNLNIKS